MSDLPRGKSPTPPAPRHPHHGAHAAPPRGLLRRVAGLAGPYLRSEERVVARLMLAAIIALTLLQIAIQVRFNLWSADFFNALENRDMAAFHRQLVVFCGLAAASMAVSVYQTYLKQTLQLRWRRWLTRQLTSRWLAGGLHYQLAFLATEIDNPDQRIAEDIRVVTEAALDFLIGVIGSTISFFCFIGILWSLSGALPVTLFGVEIAVQGYMVWFALAYAVVGSALTWGFGRPMIRANVERNAHEADFRFGLVRIREKSEEIAFYRGEDDELRLIDSAFQTLARTLRKLFGLHRRLTWLTSGYTLGAMVVPALIASPRYFSGAITLGGLMQTTQAFGQVQGALSWFVDNWPRLAEWRASLDRLLAFSEGIAEVASDAATHDEETITVAENIEERLEIRDLEIAHPDGTVIIARASATVQRGERVLIVGESGSGKSTLFRAIAGLWPWGRGEILTPRGAKLMFVPQRPYLPLGPLRAAVVYPSRVDDFDDDAIKAALERCGLGHLFERLDHEERWDHVLSGGEQQRLAFARMLLNQPTWVFMDEATAALDVTGQAALLSLFAQELKGTSVLSIGHRQELTEFHDRTLELVAAPEGAQLIAARYEQRRQRRDLVPVAPPAPRPSPIGRIGRYFRRQPAS
jgi:putative ATP-binding cassette transporter